ncbi:Mrp/NBP35 family ATP-binding protein [Gammaproteobacteria bacterium]|nr:Mrp/NBP35 family ATP-binding protein [Gammaproteobacteria bacterium]MDB9939706.1 Mrp/NBP35 family ATP-binding protein [Gammaproteobacteria bacterium]
MGIKKIIAVASAKGGVGKSSICANLAYMFSKNFTVGILDADIYGPNQHIIFDVPLSKPELIEIEGKKKFLPVQVDNISINSMGFILDSSKAAMWRGPMLSGAIKQLMDSTEWGDLDYLFIDMPPGTGDAYLTVAKDLKPDSAILVTTESPLAVQDTLKSKILFQKLNIPILGYINNMVGSFSSGGGAEDDTTNILRLDLLGSIPMDQGVANFNLMESTKLFESTYNNLKIII